VPVKRRTSGTRRARAKPTEAVSANALLQWFGSFDARMADLIVRQQALLRDLGVEPVAHTAIPEPTRESV
jgi:hypothetical protein